MHFNLRGYFFARNRTHMSKLVIIQTNLTGI